MNNDKLLGGLVGALIADAVGCPYEFKRPDNLPSYDFIDMIPPRDYNRTWAHIPVGTYTDDGAQILVLLHTILDYKDGDFVIHLRNNLKRWRAPEGFMSVDNYTFDIGNQTELSLRLHDDNVVSVLSGDEHSGNGSLMRCIAVPLTAGSLVEAIRLAQQQTLATHPNKKCQVVCSLYSGIAWCLLNGYSLYDGLDITKKTIKCLTPENIKELDKVFEEGYNEPMGSGYVVDSFWSAMSAVGRGTSYKDVVKLAIKFGNDTDTTACIAGGLAGIQYGFKGIPAEWIELLRGKNIINSVVERLILGHQLFV